VLQQRSRHARAHARAEQAASRDCSIRCCCVIAPGNLNGVPAPDTRHHPAQSAVSKRTPAQHHNHPPAQAAAVSCPGCAPLPPPASPVQGDVEHAGVLLEDGLARAHARAELLNAFLLRHCTLQHLRRASLGHQPPPYPGTVSRRTPAQHHNRPPAQAAPVSCPCCAPPLRHLCRET
jgi:hypothetical protein